MFTDEERAIFRYHDGTRERFADPMAVWRAIARLCPGDELQATQQMARTEDPAVYLPAMGRLAELAYAAFGLPPLADDGTGLPELAALSVLNAFFRWDAAEKKGPEPPPSSSPSSAGPPAASAAAAAPA